MIVGFVQTSPVFGDPEANRGAVEALVGSSTADLLVLPELFSTGYSFQSREEARRLAEEPDGPTGRFLSVLAARIGGVIVAGFAERSGGSLFNSAMAVDGNGVMCVYRKVHLFRKEKEIFSPGDLPFPVIAVPAGGSSKKTARVGMMICFDWIFPEAARTLALRGAQIIAHPSNLVLPYCQRTMLTRSLENRVFTITANRVGREIRGSSDLTFTGASQVVSPSAVLLARGTETDPAVATVRIEPAESDDKHATPENDLYQDLRPDMYERSST